MKDSRIVARLLLAVSALIVPAAAMATGLDSFLHDIEIRAGADMGSFKADLSVTFGVSGKQVDGLFQVMSRPSDVYMCLRIGELADQPVDRVVADYQRHKGQGWGVIAQNLGIKPGSEEFHALKAGRLPQHGAKPSADKQKNGRGKRGA